MKVWILRLKKGAHMFIKYPTQEELIAPLKDLLISEGFCSMEEVEEHLDEDATVELIPFDLDPLRPGLRSYGIKKILREGKVTGNFLEKKEENEMS